MFGRQRNRHGQDDPNVRDLVDRLQLYHDVVEKEFTGQKVGSFLCIGGSAQQVFRSTVATGSVGGGSL